MLRNLPFEKRKREIIPKMISRFNSNPETNEAERVFPLR
jgi:hypothetical protein